MQTLVIGRIPPGLSCGLDHSLNETGAFAGVSADEQYDCVLVNGLTRSQDWETLSDLRRNERTRLLPIFCHDEKVAESPLSDGFVPDGPALETAINQWRMRNSQLTIDPSRDLEALVLCYLWLLPSRTLRPSCNATSPQIYGYDLLQLWDVASERAWLDRTERLGLIERGILIDRLRLCPHCHSGHLNYIDCCPSCSSIDIRNEQSIHCFACGNVAEEARFLRNQKLICPNCNNPLRHIGTDYDRPIETCRCNTCQQRFVEAPVKAACLECRGFSDPNDLNIRSINEYRLAPEGEAMVRTGRSAPLRPIVYGEPTEPEHFKWVLKWLNDQAGAERPIVLAGLCLSGTGPSRGAEDEGHGRHFDELVVQLQSLLDPTDVVTVYSDDIAFVIFPSGGRMRLDAFVKDVKQIQLSQTQNQIGIVVAARALPDSGVASNAAAWLADVAAELRAQA